MKTLTLTDSMRDALCFMLSKLSYEELEIMPQAELDVLFEIQKEYFAEKIHTIKQQVQWGVRWQHDGVFTVVYGKDYHARLAGMPQAEVGEIPNKVVMRGNNGIIPVYDGLD